MNVERRGTSDATWTRQRFEGLFLREADRVLRYATHRVGQQYAEDVVAETFAVAWRRLEDIPQDACPWLLGVARKVIANDRRSRQRADQALAEIAQAVPRPAGDFTGTVDRQRDLVAALRSLAPADREAVMLVTWDDLTQAQAATVLGCSTTALAVRLHRARRRLRRSLEDTERPIRPRSPSTEVLS